MKQHDNGRRAVKSYVLRQGRITPAQARALEACWEMFGIDFTPDPIDLEQVFGRTAPKVLEIGAGAGEVTLACARQHPENDYLAVEVHRPGIGKLINQAVAQEIVNIRVVNHDVVEVLRHQLRTRCLDQVTIFFPDPWPKKRHHKRRLLNPEFVTLLGSRLKSNGLVFIATDWEDMAREVLENCDNDRQLVNLAGAGNFAPRPAWRPLTRFEQRGMRLGHRVRDLVYGLRIV